jgi:hypothetical protein
VRERERERKIHQREREWREGERKRELPQVIAQPDPLGFLPSVIIEEGRGEIFCLVEGEEGLGYKGS